MKLRLSFLLVSLLFCSIFSLANNNKPTNNEKPYTTQLTQKLADQIKADALADLEIHLELIRIGIEKEINTKLEFNKEKGTEKNAAKSTQVIVDDVVVMIYHFPNEHSSLQNNLCANSLDLFKDEINPG